MPNEEFERWAKPAYCLDKRKDGAYRSIDARIASASFSGGQESRQPEIDALNSQIVDQVNREGVWETAYLLSLKVDALQKENAALKAEVARLRKQEEKS